MERRGERVVGTSARARVCSPVVIFLLRFNNLAFFSIVVINNSRESERKNSDVEAKRERTSAFVRCLIIMGFDMTSINFL